MAIDYFIKWVETILYIIFNLKKVAQFIHANIIYRYGTPYEIAFDNGSHFRNEVVKLFKKYNITHHKSSPYKLETNGVVEATIRISRPFCKTWCKYIKIVMKSYHFALWVKKHQNVNPHFNQSCYLFISLWHGYYFSY